MKSKTKLDSPKITEVKNRLKNSLSKYSHEDLLDLISNFSTSLNGYAVGFSAEYDLIKMLKNLNDDNISNVMKVSDHTTDSKSDVSLKYKGHDVWIQVKSPLTNSIKIDSGSGVFIMNVKNHRSDRRSILIPGLEKEISVNKYPYGSYHILAVPLYMFTGRVEFAFLMEYDCKPDLKYPTLIGGTTSMTFPLSEKWTTDIYSVMENVANGIYENKISEIYSSFGYDINELEKYREMIENM